ncbi:RNA polymerase sigma factor [Pedobacter sp.]
MPLTDSHSNEQELLELLRRGDRAAFNTLYRLHAKPLYWRLLRMVKNTEETEELIQDLFVKVWEKREQIIIHQSFEAYLYRMAQHMAINFFKSLKTRSRLYEQVQAVSSEISDSTQQLLQLNETQTLLDQAIALLPEQRRKAFILCKIEGRSYQEAAELMNVSSNTVHNHLTKAVSAVKAHFERSGKVLAPLALLIVLQQL